MRKLVGSVISTICKNLMEDRVSIVGIMTQKTSILLMLFLCRTDSVLGRFETRLWQNR